MRYLMTPGEILPLEHDNDILFKKLTQKPQVAWPTILLFIMSLIGVVSSTYLYLAAYSNLYLLVGLNVISMYVAFTVVHDASHRSVVRSIDLNDWIGRAAIFIIQPLAPFSAFRALHMQHHRFANSERDPDYHICAKGSKFLLPIKWMFFDYIYMKEYLLLVSRRPNKEKAEAFYLAGISTFLFSLSIVYGCFVDVLLLWFLPSRIAIAFLVFAFDYLPHHPHSHTHQQDPFKAANIRRGYEWLLTPLLLSQNYHLAHHLYPTVPFYRYRRVWEARIKYHMSKDPMFVESFSMKFHSKDLTQSPVSSPSPYIG